MEASMDDSHLGSRGYYKSKAGYDKCAPADDPAPFIVFVVCCRRAESYVNGHHSIGAKCYVSLENLKSQHDVTNRKLVLVMSELRAATHK